MKDKMFISNGRVTVVALSCKNCPKICLAYKSEANYYPSFYSPNWTYRHINTQ